jgi:hypothetical protein
MLYSQIQGYDQRQEMHHGGSTCDFESSANAAFRQRGRGRFNNQHGRGDRRDERRDVRRDARRDERPQQSGRGGGRGRGRKRTTPWVDTICQICNKEGHVAKECWWRFEDDDDDSYGDKDANHAAYMVLTPIGTRTTGATHDITGELNNLTVHDAYQGNDIVSTANGQGMIISHIGIP